jgi:hypothetical protein
VEGFDHTFVAVDTFSIIIQKLKKKLVGEVCSFFHFQVDVALFRANSFVED